MSPSGSWYRSRLLDRILRGIVALKLAAFPWQRTCLVSCFGASPDAGVKERTLLGYSAHSLRWKRCEPRTLMSRKSASGQTSRTSESAGMLVCIGLAVGLRSNGEKVTKDSNKMRLLLLTCVFCFRSVGFSIHYPKMFTRFPTSEDDS